MTRQEEATRLYQQADKKWSQNQLRSAFRLFLAAAKAGNVKAFSIVGQFYYYGDGVEADEEAALYWYRRAARYRERSAANNVGCILRDRGNLKRAIMWFKRAIEYGDHDANLELANIYLQYKQDIDKAIHYLMAVLKSHDVTDGSREEARLLLEQIKKK